jgi:RecB family exonuclease
MVEIVESAAAAARLGVVTRFLASLAPGTEVLIVGASRDAVDDLVRGLAAGASFGLHRLTLTQLAARLAAPALSAQGLATCTRLAAEAVATRATFDALGRGTIPFFAPVARCPGFGRTLAATLTELRGAGIAPDRLAAQGAPADQLAALLEEYERQLADAALADRAALLQAATAAVAATPVDPLVGLPLALIDVPIDTEAERALVAALCAAAPRVLATLPVGDENSRRAFAALGTVERNVPPAPSGSDSLARLQEHLFVKEDPSHGPSDDAVRFFSAPGEAREAVEIARAILAEADAGTPFDRIAVFLRQPEIYTALLETAFRRAGIAAYFSRGTRRPNPAGRAFLALLDCAADRLSAARFAEYLSFGQLPAAAPAAGTAESAPDWSGPRDEALGAAATAADAADPAAADAEPGRDPAPTAALLAPWRWEALLVDAAVIGGAERWSRRLDGLAHELELRADELAVRDPESPLLSALGRQRAALADLRRFALPVIARLAALPAAAVWNDWLQHLRSLAPLVLRRPQPILQVLAELAPLAAVGPVGLGEVRDVLAERLRFVTDDPPPTRFGSVLVTALDDARARRFAVVFVPGLAERIFPQRPREDPLLLDAVRARLDTALPTQIDRDRRERLLLRLAVGAAEQRLYLSYPRLDVVQARPRVTSFYGLDVARATHGGIPDVEAFERGAASLVAARLAWPAPPAPQAAIDAAEHDLAALAELIQATADQRVRGGAQYLLELNAHLGRSLRTRYGRWERRGWSELDGLVRRTAATGALLDAQRIANRPYSPSALERFAVCPYRFFLASIQKLEPRDTVAPLEQIDPRTRGKLFHRVQAETLRALDAAGSLPLTQAGLDGAAGVLTDTLARVAARFHDDCAPPIARVWDDEVAALRVDLLHWLRRLAEQAGGWRPAYFELGFGLPPDAERDPCSRAEAVVVSGGWRLRGAVDLVECRSDGRAARVTDHKTGIDPTPAGLTVGKGEVLQPVLYGLAVEAALDLPVHESRLFFCTARGGFAEHSVVLDERARSEGLAVLATIDAAIAAGFLPPAPRADACERCDFRIVCGPYEEERLRRKDPSRLAALAALRRRP